MAHVTFKKMMNEVVAFGSCCECGTCVLVCPHNVIDYVDGKPKQVAKATAAFDYCGISEGIGCDVCAQVCPRLGTREFDLRDAVLPDGSQGSTTASSGATAGSSPPAARTRRSSIALPGWRSRDGDAAPRAARGMFDGACVSAADETMPAAPKPKVVTTVDEAIASASSLVHVLPQRPRPGRCRAHGAPAGLLRRRALPGHAGPEDAARRPGVPRPTAARRTSTSSGRRSS